MKKKPWTKPELIVLVRNTPEEAVLGVCKHETVFGPETLDWYCFDHHCDQCESWNPS